MKYQTKINSEIVNNMIKENEIMNEIMRQWLIKLDDTVKIIDTIRDLEKTNNLDFDSTTINNVGDEKKLFSFYIGNDLDKKLDEFILSMRKNKGFKITKSRVINKAIETFIYALSSTNSPNTSA